MGRMNQLAKSLRMFLWLTLVTGVVYPLLLTVFAQTVMKERADGKIVHVHDKVVGAQLIGQKFTSEKYFWGRPSATDYNALPSSGSNLGPLSKELQRLVAERRSHYAVGEKSHVPSELLFASGSGLDPHISPAAAYFQVERVIKARGLKEEEGKILLSELIVKNTTQKYLSFLGRRCVNVLMLNISLDEATEKHE